MREPRRWCANPRCLDEIDPDDPGVVLVRLKFNDTGFNAVGRRYELSDPVYYHRDHQPANAQVVPMPDSWDDE